MTGRPALPILLAAAIAGGCQSMAVPAVMTRADPASMERLKGALAKAMGQRKIELGPGDPTQTSLVSVLPLPPSQYEDRSLAKPTLFRLELEEGVCTLVREDSGARTPADGLACRPAQH